MRSPRPCGATAVANDRLDRSRGRCRSVTALVCFACGSSAALAHGFGQRFDLPLPLAFWLAGAGATIVLTFVLVALFSRDQPLRQGHSRSGPVHSRIARAPVPWGSVRALRGIVAAAFALTITTGLFGTQSPYNNLSITMVWVVWWVGVAFVSALIGNVWALVDPLRTIFSWCEAGYARWTGGRPLSREFHYPSSLGAWPAVLLFWGFAWCELVCRGKDVPVDLAGALLGYAALTWLGMFLFGRTRWPEHGEAFSIAFGVLARFAPLDVAADDEPPTLRLRPPGAGLVVDSPVGL